MVKKYPELERGESVSKTGRDHIPPRLFKEMAHLNKQREKLETLIGGINPLNKKHDLMKFRTFLTNSSLLLRKCTEI